MGELIPDFNSAFITNRKHDANARKSRDDQSTHKVCLFIGHAAILIFLKGSWKVYLGNRVSKLFIHYSSPMNLKGKFMSLFPGYQ